MTKNSTKKIPRLRFKGFEGEWEEKKLSDVGKIITGNTPKTSITSNYNDNGFPWVTPYDISHNNKSKTNKKLSKEGVKKARIVPKGSILFTCIGNSIGTKYLSNRNVAFNQQINSIIPKNIDSYYLFSRFCIVNNIIDKFSSNGTIPIINKKEFSSLKFLFPLLPEQQKIGSFFTKLDQLIDLQSKKIEQLKKLKRGYLQKMFPQKDEIVPRLRFDGFSGEWKEKKIIDILSYEQPNKYIVKSDKYFNYGIPVLTANKSFLLGYTNESNIYKGLKCIIFDDFTQNFKYVNFPFKVKSSAIKILTSKNDDNLYFIFNMMKSLNFISEGHSRHYISNVQFMNVKIPDIEEQKIISRTIESLDKYLKCNKDKVYYLNKIKDAYLQKMFI